MTMTSPASPDPRSGRTFRSLSPSRQQLLTRLQRLNFGRVEWLEVHQGEPVLDESLAVVREVKFGGDNGPRPESLLPDFPLKESQRALLALFDQIQNGTILNLTVKHGLPFHAEVAG